MNKKGLSERGSINLLREDILFPESCIRAISALSGKPSVRVVCYMEPDLPWVGLLRTIGSLLKQTIQPVSVDLVGVSPKEVPAGALVWLQQNCPFPIVRGAQSLDFKNISEGGASLLLMRGGIVLHSKAIEAMGAAEESDNLSLNFCDSLEGGVAPAEGQPRLRPDWNPDLFKSTFYLGSVLYFPDGFWNELEIRRPQTLATPGLVAQTLFYDLVWQVMEVVSDGGPKLSAKDIPSGIPMRGFQRSPEILYWVPEEVFRKMHYASAQEMAMMARTELWKKGMRCAENGYQGYRWYYPLPETLPLVSLIVCTRNYRSVLEPCVESIFNKTSYPKFEIIIADNDSDEAETLDYFRILQDRGVKIVRVPGPFNFSAINNRAAEVASGEILGFLNNDLEVSDEGWLNEIVSHVLRPEIGAVGPRLLYPDGRVQHAGVLLGVGHVGAHGFRFFDPNEPGPFGRLQHTQNYSAVTAACVFVRKEIFQLIQGFDETNLTVSNNDVDFCLRILEAGYWNLYTPYAVLIHHESASRGGEFDEPLKKSRYQSEVRYMKRRWGKLLRDDPAYNPRLTKYAEDFTLAQPLK